MYKKGLLVMILIGTLLSMSGCIVINTGQSDKDKSSSNEGSTKEVIIKDKSDNSSNNSNNNSSNNSSNDSNNNSNNNSSSKSNNNSSNNRSRAYEVSGYIFYDSDSRYLTSSDLYGLSSWELKLARNEIYARRGRRFKNSALQNYFDSCSWYYGYIAPDDFNDNSLNTVEQYNVNFIKKFE